MSKLALFLIVIASFTGCTTTRFENYPLAPHGTNQDKRSLDVSHKNRPTILLAISGGGSRAAALGWTILKELRQFKYLDEGQTHALVNDVSMISSVSGGSVIAAYYGLYGADKLDNFKAEFLDLDNMKTLGIDGVNPLTWFNIAITGSSRIDLVEELFDQQLFHGKTFSELNRPGKPYVILNTTDMAGGEIFAFTPDQFNHICSDFDKEPISVGVAASAAFPVLLTPVTFQNYSKAHCQTQPAPQWITNELNHKFSPYLNIAEYKKARYANDLRNGTNTFRSIDYLHFLDGGLADNLGVHSLIDAVSSITGLAVCLIILVEET